MSKELYKETRQSNKQQTTETYTIPREALSLQAVFTLFFFKTLTKEETYGKLNNFIGIILHLLQNPQNLEKNCIATGDGANLLENLGNIIAETIHQMPNSPYDYKAIHLNLTKNLKKYLENKYKISDLEIRYFPTSTNILSKLQETLPNNTLIVGPAYNPIENPNFDYFYSPEQINSKILPTKEEILEKINSKNYQYLFFTLPTINGETYNFQELDEIINTAKKNNVKLIFDLAMDYTEFLGNSGETNGIHLDFLLKKLKDFDNIFFFYSESKPFAQGNKNIAYTFSKKNFFGEEFKYTKNKEKIPLQISSPHEAILMLFYRLFLIENKLFENQTIKKIKNEIKNVLSNIEKTYQEIKNLDLTSILLQDKIQISNYQNLNNITNEIIEILQEKEISETSSSILNNLMQTSKKEKINFILQANYLLYFLIIYFLSAQTIVEKNFKKLENRIQKYKNCNIELLSGNIIGGSVFIKFNKTRQNEEDFLNTIKNFKNEGLILVPLESAAGYKIGKNNPIILKITLVNEEEYFSQILQKLDKFVDYLKDKE